MPPEMLAFLSDLERNNRREWFQSQKSRYEMTVKEPALGFVADFAPRLARISPHFEADPRPVGGSLFRIYRDTRFSRDKTPYKTHVGIQFRHARGKSVHAPGFYLHVDPYRPFAGLGVWHPDGPTLASIRDAIVADPDGWRKAAHGKALRRVWDVTGDTLKRPPRGYPQDHPFVEDLKLKDFTAIAALTPDDLTAPDFARDLAALFRKGAPLMGFLCRAVGVAY
ncbi:DUF2461 domain-containing protein [bacterium]|nr:DUF2461 domain-containing protein [bacterium]MBU1071966.1 DUF2461 domain-containing protein [bacterium]MBU1677017.1 DUF2461 domain-containing protein [bacterium]